MESNIITLRVHFVYEYKTDPNDYPEDSREPEAMARYDLEQDSSILFASDGDIERVEIL